MKPPTEKQLSFAKIISTELMVELPEEKTRQSLFLFIRDNRPEFDAIQQNKKFDAIQRNKRRDWAECLVKVFRHIAESMGIGILAGWRRLTSFPQSAPSSPGSYSPPASLGGRGLSLKEDP